MADDKEKSGGQAILRDKRRDGQVLVEMIVSITLGLTGLLGVITLLTQTSKLSKDTRSDLMVAFLAVEGIEIVKNLIDTDIARGRASGPWNETVSCGAGDYEVDYTTKVIDDGGCPNPKSGAPLTFSPDRRIGGYRHSGPGGNTIFYRWITVSQPNANEIRVWAHVSWMTRGEARNMVLQDVFKNWRD